MGKLMADMGALVIKIEPPGGDPARHIGPFVDNIPDPNRSLHFWANNTSKKSITLDIHSRTGQTIFLSLVGRADIILESFDPGYLQSLGLGYHTLKNINRPLIMTSLTGFGQTGPYRDYKTTDLVALAMGGIMHSCGYNDVDDSPPIAPSGGHGYYIGAHYGLIGTLAALLYRDYTGEGQYVDASIHEACSCITEAAVPHYFYTRNIVQRQTARHHSPYFTPKTLCATKDEGYVTIFALFTNFNSWLTLVKWMEEAGMAEDLTATKYQDMARQNPRGGADVEHAYAVVRRFIAAHTAEEIYRGAQARRFPWGIIRCPEDTLEDPHFRYDRKFFANIYHPEIASGIQYTYPGRPYVFSQTPWHATRAPMIGEHTDSILQEFSENS